ncbi:BTAD domain-containing putative transcriptional regulator [Pseudonocardia sp. H11422]|uniref:BTAD domain-containing putative transcriptional regulator n=1 Tax=Pseudonocardia sp. H11422 TaxID=2835866 RepID=UPI001BDC46FC|nr:BTAD domain-containing putative transcriptional regulator [Pseudonocardia sp. H11422]
MTDGRGVTIGVLGPLLVVGDDGAPVVVRSVQRRLLLGLLVAYGDRAVQADELAEWLWADRSPAEPHAALQSHVSRLRRQLGAAAAWIATTSTGYRFVGPPDRVDSTRFERLLAGARECGERPEAALQQLDEALGLWRAGAYSEFADHPAIAPQAARLEELRADAAELRAGCLLTLGRPAEAASTMQRLTADHPFRERPVALAMRALAQDGRHADALQEFRRFRRLLDGELGLEPSPALRTVEAAILGHGERTRPLVPAVGVPGNSFVGRDAEVGRTAWLLDRSRLVTLTGPGGVGKTRIAVHVAAGAADSYPGGVYLCELARVSDPDAAISAVASVLQVEHRADRPLLDRVIEFLHVRRALLVLDNCEHVLAATAGLVTAVLLRTADVDVLATSRERLGVEGEQRVPVGPLATPAWDDPAGPAAVLFADRVRAVRPDLKLGPEDASTVSELCRRLDGLPLAIELAAARTVSRSPSEILAAITDRLDGLSDRRRAVARHRSLHAVFDWSYDLLGRPERAAFEQLAVFAGGWTAAAAAAVAGADADTLGELVERSLVTARRSGRDTRYSMLEPIRQYAETRLRERGVLQGTRGRHAAWAVRCAEAADAGLRGPDETYWRGALDGELANLRAGQRWCLDHDRDGAVRLAASLYRYTWAGAPSEVYAWAEQAVARFPDPGPACLPAAFAAAAFGTWHRGDLPGARRLAEAGIAAAVEDPAGGRSAWEVLGDVETFLGSFDRAAARFERATALARRAGDDHQAAITLLDGALCQAYGGRVEVALDRCAAAAPLVAAVGNPSLAAWSDYVNGEVRLDRDPADALPYLRRSVTAARRIGNRLIVGVAGLSAASGEARAGQPAAVLARYGELIEHWHRDGAWNMLWATLRTLVELLARVGRDAEAAVIYGAMTASATAPPLAGADVTRIGEAVAAMRIRLGAGRFATACADGAALSDGEAVAFALACVGRPPRPLPARQST